MEQRPRKPSLNPRSWESDHLISLPTLLISHPNQYLHHQLFSHFSPFGCWDVPFLLRDFWFVLGQSFLHSKAEDSWFILRNSYKVRCVLSFQKIFTIVHFSCKPWQYYTVSTVTKRQDPYRAIDQIRHADDFFFLNNPLVIQIPSIF